MAGKDRKYLEQIREDMERFDAQKYFETGEMDADITPETAAFAQKVADAARTCYSASLLKKQMQYTALQSQINPHFLYNTLEAIRSEALLCSHMEIAEMTEKLGRFFRYCISSQEDFVSIRDELYNLQDYFYIQQCRFGSRFTLDMKIEEEELVSCFLPKMTLQPIVENGIFHGLEQKKGAGRITIRLIGTAKKVYLIVSDDGIGMSQDEVTAINERLKSYHEPEPGTQGKRHGIALLNVNARLRLYFGEEYGLRLNSVVDRGTDVEIVIPRLGDAEFNRLKSRAEGL